jgi:hypothetical protein
MTKSTREASMLDMMVSEALKQPYTQRKKLLKVTYQVN